jgi:hypothetical protein
LIADLNTSLISGTDEDEIIETITTSIKDAIEAMEVEVEADSHYYWEADEVYAQYEDHQFRDGAPGQVAIDLVRVTEQEVVVRLSATITCLVHASFALSMTDPIDKEQVSLGSHSAEVQQTFDSDVLVTFEGDFAQGLAGVVARRVEVVDQVPTVDFGEVEVDWGRDDDLTTTIRFFSATSGSEQSRENHKRRWYPPTPRKKLARELETYHPCSGSGEPKRRGSQPGVYRRCHNHRLAEQILNSSEQRDNFLTELPVFLLMKLTLIIQRRRRIERVDGRNPEAFCPCHRPLGRRGFCGGGRVRIGRRLGHLPSN